MDDRILLGDVIRTRKPHPCGCDSWVVTRIGADIKIKCQGCGRIVMLDREAFLKRRKAVLQRGPEPDIEGGDSHGIPIVPEKEGGTGNA